MIKYGNSYFHRCRFLDAGKTTFIKDALQKDGFSEKGKTLVILCEEGEIELTKDL